MKKFHFNLQPALQVRQRLQEAAQLELADRQRRLSREEARLEELRRELRRHELSRAEMQRRSLDLSALVEADRYGHALNRALWHQEERIAEARSAVETARDALRRRHTEREALDRLRERRLAEHREAALCLEQRELDEAAGVRWKRED
jgi:flagellar FliJ protein